MHFLVRPETPDDQPGIRLVIASVFPTSAEADLVEDLRREAWPFVSLVAEETSRVIGHIMFTPVTIPGSEGVKMMGLAPMAVFKPYHGMGVGKSLVRAGLEECRKVGAAAVVVLGLPDYYPKFGFARASKFGLSCDYDVPDDTFMALELWPNALQGRGGRVKYHPVFARHV